MNTATETIEIPISKSKTLLMIIGCLAFVCLSIWLWSIANNQIRYSPIYVKGIAIVSVIFFGLGLIIGPKKLFDKTPGLVIDDNGIMNNLGFSTGFFIPWSNITGFEVMKVRSTKLLLIFINNADELIKKESKLKQKIMIFSNRTYGTPISIGSGTLQIKFDQLEKLLTDRHTVFNRTNAK